MIQIKVITNILLQPVHVIMCGAQIPHMIPKIPTYWCMLCIIPSPRVWVELVDKTGELLL